VHAVAGILRITDKLDQRVTRLSGGQMQRVALGRALVRSPSIYLMDEPLSSLDARLRAELRIELRRIQQELGATILYVTHDQTEAMTLASRIGVIDRGRLVQLGTPREIYEDPANAYVASRLGSPSINLLPRRLFPNMVLPAGTETIGLRTEHTRIHRGDGFGTVTWVEHLGDQDHLHVKVQGHDIVTLSDPEDGLAPGDAVRVEPVAPLLFDVAGERVRA
jgi:multiple sugar transport system ATP-binding protein